MTTTPKRRPATRKKHATVGKIERIYTHADIAAFFTSNFGKIKDPTYELRKISLLPQISPPAWEVSYIATYHSPYGSNTHFDEVVILQLTREDGTPYLNLAHATELPAGFSTPQEEDAEIERREQAQLEAWRKKWEAERAHEMQVQVEGNGMDNDAQSHKEGQA
jgi:hypothetical protein